MVRTQIQLTEEQARALHELAARRGVSLAELIREGAERVLAEAGRRDRREAARALLGRYHIGPDDAARHHDRYLYDEPSSGR